jgi:hypothetical protein
MRATDLSSEGQITKADAAWNSDTRPDGDKDTSLGSSADLTPPQRMPLTTTHPASIPRVDNGCLNSDMFPERRH